VWALLSSVNNYVLLDASILLRHARFHLRQGKVSRLDRRLAIHHAHQAVELTLKARVEQLHGHWDTFPLALNWLNQQMMAIPYERELIELNKARNLVQHSDMIPDERDAYRLVTAAENFMKDFCSKVFGLDFSQLSLVQFISDVGIRTMMTGAQLAIENQDFDEAVGFSELAIETAKRTLINRFRPYRASPLSVDEESTADKLGLPSLPESIEKIWESINYLLDLVLSAPFATDLQRLHEITHSTFYVENGEVVRAGTLAEFVRPPVQNSPTGDEAEFALELATEYILWVEQNFGLKEPQL
jgi:HEPN domain-containing protein